VQHGSVPEMPRQRKKIKKSSRDGTIPQLTRHSGSRLFPLPLTNRRVRGAAVVMPAASRFFSRLFYADLYLPARVSSPETKEPPAFLPEAL
jgi:hypothetical protein